MNGTTAFECIVRSQAETEDWGIRLGRALSGGDFLGLIGTLGAGKTHLTKGIALGAGFADSSRVTSPTFVLVNEYPGRVYLYHLDAYRLRSPAELAAIGFEEMLERDAAIIIEWADRVPELMPPDRLEIRMEILGPNERRIHSQAHGPKSERLLQAIRTTSE